MDTHSDQAAHRDALPGRDPRRTPVDGLVGFPGEATAPEDACITSPAGADHAPSDPELAQLLARTRTVAVVGMSPNPQRTSHGVAEWLHENAHFQMFFVNPVAKGETALGQQFYSSLSELPTVPDLVDVFRRPELVPPVAQESVEIGAETLWMQLGIVNDDAARTAREAGLDVIQNRCLKVEYRRLREQIIALRSGAR